MEELPRANPRPLPEPTARFLISLQPNRGDNPIGLEEEIASLIRSACSQEGHGAEPEEDAWAPADEANPAPETVAVEARLFHAIDQIAVENPRRVEERGRASAPPLENSENEGGCSGRTDPAPSPLGDLEEKIRYALRRCHRDGIHLSAEVIDVNGQATAQHSHERSGRE